MKTHSTNRPLSVQEIARLTNHYMQVWMQAWEAANEAAVEQVVNLFATNGVYHATPFIEGVGHAGIRIYESMIRTQQNGKGSVKFLGVADRYGVFRWQIQYEVVPKQLWASRLPQTMIDAPEWESYRAIEFATDRNTLIEQAGLSTVEFNREGLVTHYRQAWHTRVLS